MKNILIDHFGAYNLCKKLQSKWNVTCYLTSPFLTKKLVGVNEKIITSKINFDLEIYLSINRIDLSYLYF